MEYLIRKCRVTDLPELVALCERHAAFEKADYNPDGKQPKLKEAIFGTSAKLSCLVVEAENKLVGFASFTFDFSTWDAALFLHLDCLYLDAAYRGWGIGEKLVQQIKATAVNHSCVNVQWQTPDWNVRAIRFYQRIGGDCKPKARFTLDPGQ